MASWLLSALVKTAVAGVGAASVVYTGVQAAKSAIASAAGISETLQTALAAEARHAGALRDEFGTLRLRAAAEAQQFMPALVARLQALCDLATLVGKLKALAKEPAAKGTGAVEHVVDELQLRTATKLIAGCYAVAVLVAAVEVQLAISARMTAAAIQHAEEVRARCLQAQEARIRRTCRCSSGGRSSGVTSGGAAAAAAADATSGVVGDSTGRSGERPPVMQPLSPLASTAAALDAGAAAAPPIGGGACVCGAAAAARAADGPVLEETQELRVREACQRRHAEALRALATAVIQDGLPRLCSAVRAAAAAVQLGPADADATADTDGAAATACSEPLPPPPRSQHATSARDLLAFILQLRACCELPHLQAHLRAAAPHAGTGGDVAGAVVQLFAAGALAAGAGGPDGATAAAASPTVATVATAMWGTVAARHAPLADMARRYRRSQRYAPSMVVHALLGAADGADGESTVSAAAAAAAGSGDGGVDTEPLATAAMVPWTPQSLLDVATDALFSPGFTAAASDCFDACFAALVETLGQKVFGQPLLLASASGDVASGGTTTAAGAAAAASAGSSSAPAALPFAPRVTVIIRMGNAATAFLPVSAAVAPGTARSAVSPPAASPPQVGADADGSPMPEAAPLLQAVAGSPALVKFCSGLVWDAKL